MFIDVPNENRIKRELRYVHYVFVYPYLWKFKFFLQRIRYDGIRVVLPFSFLVDLITPSSDLSKLLTLALVPFGIKFKLISKSEYHEKHCGNIAWQLQHHLIFVCSGTTNMKTHMRLIE
jgi:hypothetical protein